MVTQEAPGYKTQAFFLVLCIFRMSRPNVRFPRPVKGLLYPWSILQHQAGSHACTMRFGSTAKVLLKCKLKYYRISECACWLAGHGPVQVQYMTLREYEEPLGVRGVFTAAHHSLHQTGACPARCAPGSIPYNEYINKTQYTYIYRYYYYFNYLFFMILIIQTSII